MAGFRDRVSKEIQGVPWQRVLDLVIRLGAEIPVYAAAYREGASSCLYAYD